MIHVAQPDALLADARERDRRDRDQGVGHQQQHGRDDGGATGGLAGVVGLLVDGDGRVPAPVDEHRDERGGDDGRQAQTRRREPREARLEVSGRGVAAVDLRQREQCEPDEREHLDAEQGVLEAGRDLDAAVADVGHHGDPDDPGHRAPERARREVVEAEEAVGVGACDLREVRHHDDVGDDDAPPAEPPRAGAEGPGGPGERRAAVGLRLVELGVGDRDEVHRDERHHHDQRGLHSDDAVAVLDDDDVAQARRKAVGRRRGGDTHDDAAQQAERTALETFALRLPLPRLRRLARGHGPSFLKPLGEI
jgi:hypothetical protein